MAIDIGTAYTLAYRLTLIPECPQAVEAVEALADTLRGLCPDEKTARALVTQACTRWERWKGPHGLLELVQAARPAPAPSNQAVDLGPKPAIDCAACGDWGYFSDGGEVRWCTCEAGRDTREHTPGLVESLNRKKIKPPHEAAARAPITQADIDQAFDERQDRTGEMIAEQRAVLDDPAASADRKEIAREILRSFGDPPAD